jgi:hypothetical protein
MTANNSTVRDGSLERVLRDDLDNEATYYSNLIETCVLPSCIEDASDEVERFFDAALEYWIMRRYAHQRPREGKRYWICNDSWDSKKGWLCDCIE